MKKTILGLAGQPASGKGTIAEYLIGKYGAVSYRFSKIINDILGRLYLEISRENQQNISTILRQNLSEDVFAKVIFEDVKKDNNEVIVVDGVRRLADIKYLRQIPEFKLVFVEADIKKRYERITKRNEKTDDENKTFEQFEKDHLQEAESQIAGLKEQADFILDNNGSFEDLYKQIEKLVK